MTALEKAKQAAEKAAKKVNVVVDNHNKEMEEKKAEKTEQEKLDAEKVAQAVAELAAKEKAEAEKKAEAEAFAKKVLAAKKRIKELEGVLIPTNENTLKIPTIPAEVKAFIEKQIADYQVELETLRETIGEKETVGGIDKYLSPVLSFEDTEIAKTVKESFKFLTENKVLVVGGLYKVTDKGIQEIPQLVKDCPLKFHYSGMREANKKEKEAKELEAKNAKPAELPATGTEG